MLHDLDISCFINDINNYISGRGEEPNKISSFGGYSKGEKIDVALRLLSLLRGEDVDLSNKEISILRNGRLGDICRKFAKNNGFNTVRNLLLNGNLKSNITKLTESNYSQIIYEIVKNSAQWGIGNCTQTANRVTYRLSTGQKTIPSFRERLPGTRSRDCDYELGGTPEEFLVNIKAFLGEGQHCQVSAQMLGRVKEAMGMSHVFNAIKILGEVKLVDTYIGWSREMWLNESWNNPRAFLNSFSDFSVSQPEICFYAWKKNRARGSGAIG